jgi:molybdenum cofactor biosynthesis protein B
VGVHEHGLGPGGVRVAILTVSDSRGPDQDESGRIARELVEAAGHSVCAYAVVPDEPQRIDATLRAWIARPDCDAVIVSGGTGIARRDRTIETVASLIDQPLDGFGELFRALSFEQVGSRAMLSRALGGIAGGRPLFVLPGSPRAVELGLRRLILPELDHVLAELEK